MLLLPSTHLDCPNFQLPPSTDTTTPITVLQSPSPDEQMEAEDILAALVCGQQSQPMDEQKAGLLSLFVSSN